MRNAIMCAALAAVAGTASAQNLLVNPSFENQGTGFLTFEAWGTFNNAFADPPFGSGLAPEVPPRTGSVSMKTFGSFIPASQSDTGAFQLVDVTAGQQYTLSGWTYTPSADPIQDQIDDGDPATFDEGHLPLLIIDFKDAGGNNIESLVIEAHDFSSNPQDQWTQYSGSAVAPVGSVEAQVTPLLIQFGEPTGSLFWDDLSLTEGSAPPQPCNAADIAAPFGQLTFADISAFLSLFAGGCP